MAPKVLRIAGFLLLVSAASSQFLSDIHRQHIGCFKDNADKRDLNFRVQDDDRVGTVETCVRFCTELYFMYAGVQNGDECYCGSTYGRYGPGQCTTRCSKNEDEVCGGQMTSTIYSTEVKVPGPPSDLRLTKVTTNSLSIQWDPSNAPEDFVTGYHVFASLNQSYDPRSQRFNPKELQLSGSTRSTTIIGLLPGSKFNVSVAAASEEGPGPVISRMLWTEIGEPTAPATPQLIHHHDHDDDDSDDSADAGEIHIKFSPLKYNAGGPVTSYRVVVLNETAPAPFVAASLADWPTAQEQGLPYWIAAEIAPDWFDHHDEFVVGDGRYYGPYRNYGPLFAGKHDYHVTVGTVSTLNNVTKVAYAKVSHDQHHHDNIVVFSFHSHGDDDEHDHDHSNVHVHDVARDRHGGDFHTPTDGGGAGKNSLDTILLTAIGVFTVILLAMLIFYVALRVHNARKRRRSPHGDGQELTAQSPSSTDMDAYAIYDNDVNAHDASLSTDSRMEALRGKVWQIPRNFLELSHEVIGRGRFGSVIKGRVNKRGKDENAIVQVVPGKILEEEETRNMIQDIEKVVGYGLHSNLLQLLGLCEEQDTLFVVLEEATTTLKQVLLDSRALVHHPVYAQKHGTVSTLKEEVVVDMMLGVARGMDHLVKNRIAHRKLCARSVFLSSSSPPPHNTTPKIGSVGICDHSKPGQEVDHVRWTAPEALRGQTFYVSKCDVWSFGCLLWEAVTLGGTPYSDVRAKDVPGRVMRGLRLAQPDLHAVSDDLYQLMLDCWQVDLDERPTFESLVDRLADIAQQGGNHHLNYQHQPGFDYQHFANDLELH